MESKSFVKLLRKIIREEVGRAVKQALTESNLNQVTKSNVNLTEIMEDPMPNRPRAKKKFAKNSLINDLLNETATTADFASMRQGPAVMQEEYPTMGSFKADMAQSISTPAQPLATTDTHGKPVNMANEKVANVMSAMTRDYSGLIKAIDKKNGKMGTIK